MKVKSGGNQKQEDVRRQLSLIIPKLNQLAAHKQKEIVIKKREIKIN